MRGLHGAERRRLHLRYGAHLGVELGLQVSARPLMKLTGLALLLVFAAVDAAWAQPQVTRGGGLKKRQYQTYAAMTLYVDPTGSDSNACTSSGTDACLTLQGAINKIPPNIHHIITINVAAGTYASTVRIAGFSFTPASGTFAQILLEGAALGNITPATGSATGTISTISATANPLPVITDSSGTWTTNNLRGYFLVMTSGAQAGQAQAIVANTATTITTTVWVSTAPIAGSTFSIQAPTSFIGALTASTLTGTGTVRLARLEATSASTAVTGTSIGSGLSLTAPLSRAVPSGSGTGFRSTNSPAWQGASLTGVTDAPLVAMALGASGVAFTATNVPSGSLGNGRGYAIGGLYGAAVTYSPAWAPSQGWSWVFETTSSTANAAYFHNVGAWDLSGNTNSSLSFRCPSGSTGYGLALTGASRIFVYNLESTNCGTGFHLGVWSPVFEPPNGGQALTAYTSLRCTNTTTCLLLSRGARVNLRAAPTFTGVTTEYSLDGTTLTESFFSTLSPARAEGSLGSVLERQ